MRIEEAQKLYVKCNADRFFEGIDFKKYDEKCDKINVFLKIRGDRLKSFVEKYKPINEGVGALGGVADHGSTEQLSEEASSVASEETSTDSSPTVDVKRTSIKTIVVGKKSFTIKWKKVKNIDGYQLQYSTKKDFRKSARKTININKKKTSYTVKKLKSNKKYYVRMRGYKIIEGEKRYSNWSVLVKNVNIL